MGARYMSVDWILGILGFGGSAYDGQKVAAALRCIFLLGTTEASWLGVAVSEAAEKAFAEKVSRCRRHR